MALLASRYELLEQLGQGASGTVHRARDQVLGRDIAVKLQQHIWPLLEQGRIKPVIYQRFPLADAPAAHALMESSQHIGKILLTC